MEKLTGGTLTPAYGRDYTKRASIVEDLNADKDFTMSTFNFNGYCSIRDLADGAYQVRFNRNRNVSIVHVKNGVAK